MEKKILKDLARSRAHLEYSFNKVTQIDLEQLNPDDEETLETLESFSSRFARFSDLVISKYIRFKVYESDPGFRGSLIDMLNYAEKMSWISSARLWRRIRELRNIAAHEYSAEEYKKLYKELIELCPELLNFKF